MVRVYATVVAALLALSVLPATGQVASAVACESDDGRERLTVEGFDATFDAPVVTYPGLASPVNNNVGPLQELRSAPFPFTLEVAPSARADLRIRLDWAQLSDFDVFVYDDNGVELARAAEDNTANGLTHEEALLTVPHCQRLTVAVRSWSSSPAEELALTISVAPSTTLLACADGDPAPNCAGKAPGAAPDPSPADARTRLYLGGGAPGQASMAWHYAQSQVGSNAATQALPSATLAPDRPTGGVPNGHTRVVGGFRQDNATAYRNPLIPHWSADFAAPRDVVGDVTAVLWVSSRTIDETGRFFVDLWIDGMPVDTVEVPGEQIRQEPTRIAVTFDAVSHLAARGVTLQAATEPAATSGGQVNNAREAEVTVHYGSVQFPAFVTLP